MMAVMSSGKNVFWIRRLWVEIVSAIGIAIGIAIAAFRLEGWHRWAALLSGLSLFIPVAVLAAYTLARRRRVRDEDLLSELLMKASGFDPKLSTVGARGWGSLLESGIDTSQLQIIDRQVRFTIYRPERVRPDVWTTMLAFAYRGADANEGGADIRESFKNVQRQAAAALGPQIQGFASLTTESQHGIPREAMLRFVPRFEGLDFNPPERSFLWIEKIHREDFRFRVPRELDGQVVHGRMEVYFGIILIAGIDTTITVDSGVEPAEAEPEAAAHGGIYRKIFACYSRKDRPVVARFGAFASAFGDEFMRDWTHLRAGEVWSEQLQSMIFEADVFQLFWSNNSIESDFVRQEWEYALSLSRSSFIRPVYWEEPMPERPDRGLPPDSLRRLHFYKFKLVLDDYLDSHRLAFDSLPYLDYDRDRGDLPNYMQYIWYTLTSTGFVYLIACLVLLLLALAAFFIPIFKEIALKPH
jgi:hypothetical protein